MQSTPANLTSGVVEGVHMKHWRKKFEQTAEDCMVDTTAVEQGLIVSTEKHVIEGGVGVSSNGHSGKSPVTSLFVVV